MNDEVGEKSIFDKMISLLFFCIDNKAKKDSSKAFGFILRFRILIGFS